MRRSYRVVLGVVMAMQLTTLRLLAEETNTLELIKQLQQRITDLESTVKSLQGLKPAEPTPAEKERVADLEQKVKILERNRELEIEAGEAKAKETPEITLGTDGFAISSADGQFGVQLKGLLQLDSRTFFNDSGTRGNDGFLLRRARPMVQGTLWSDFDFLFVPDFGGTGNPQIFDAYVNYRCKPGLQLRAGKFKVPVGLEQLQADADVMFNERSLVTAMVPNRDLGVQLHGEIFEGLFGYAAGIFNGVGDARNSSNFDFDDNKSFAGRVFFQPFKRSSSPLLQGIGLGVGGSYDDQQGVNVAGLPSTTGSTGGVPGYATAGQQQFFGYNPGSNAVVVAEGQHWRLSPQAWYYYGSFGFLGEYVISDQQVSRTVTAPLDSAELEHHAWQVTGSWILTGEQAAFKGGVTPRKRFNPVEGNWGALQLVARYEEADIDEDAFPLFSNAASSARGASAWSVGLNWYLNRNVLLKTSYSQTSFDGGGATGAVTHQDEHVLFTRIQLAF
jgi:phosphate-selective porin OprO and OprP